MPSLVGPGRLLKANVLQGLGANLATVLGPALAGILIVAAGGGGWAIVVDAASFAVNAAMLGFVKIPADARPEAERKVGVFQQLHDGWSAFISVRWYVTLVGCFAGFNFFMGVFLTPGPVVAKQDLGGAKAWAAMMTAGAIGSVIGGLALMRFAPRHPLRAGRLLGLPFALMLVLVALALPVAALCAYSAVACACFFSYLALPLGYIFAGLLGSIANPRVVLASAGIGLIILALLGAFALSIWRFTLPDQEPSPATPCPACP